MLSQIQQTPPAPSDGATADARFVTKHAHLLSLTALAARSGVALAESAGDRAARSGWPWLRGSATVVRGAGGHG
jgi:hypothetical protein